MSLINKVLIDLDRRAKTNHGVSANQPLFTNLHPVAISPLSSGKNRLLLLLGLLAVLGAGAWYYWQPQHQATIVSAPVQAVPDQPMVEATPAPGAVKNDLAQTPAPIASSTPTTTTPSVIEVSVPATQQDDRPAAPGNALPDDSTETDMKLPGAEILAVPTAVTPDEPPQLQRIMHSPSTEEQAEDLYRRAVTLVRTGKVREGGEILRQSLLLDSRHTAARETLATLLLKERKLEEAKQLLSEGVALLPGYAPFSTQLARIYVEGGDEALAINLLEDNRDIANPDPAYLGLLGTLYQRASRHDAARDAFRQAIRLQSEEGRWWLGLGISSEALNDWITARDAFQRTLSTTPTDPKIRQYAEQRLLVVKRHLP